MSFPFGDSGQEMLKMLQPCVKWAPGQLLRSDLRGFKWPFTLIYTHTPTALWKRERKKAPGHDLLAKKKRKVFF